MQSSEDIITWNEKNRAEINRAGGIAGIIMDAVMLEERANIRVYSEWVAGRRAYWRIKSSKHKANRYEHL